MRPNSNLFFTFFELRGVYMYIFILITKNHYLLVKVYLFKLDLKVLPLYIIFSKLVHDPIPLL